MALECFVNSASPGTAYAKQEETRNEAESKGFRGGRSVQKREQLKGPEVRKRLQRICKETGYCRRREVDLTGDPDRKLTLDDYADLVVTALNPRTWGRVEINIRKLFQSRRTTDEQVVRLVKGSRDKEGRKEFFQAVQDIFSGAGLFYYKRYSPESALGTSVVCFTKP